MTIGEFQSTSTFVASPTAGRMVTMARKGGHVLRVLTDLAAILLFFRCDAATSGMRALLCSGHTITSLEPFGQQAFGPRKVSRNTSEADRWSGCPIGGMGRTVSDIGSGCVISATAGSIRLGRLPAVFWL
jgi:hypothetical protein